MLADEGHLWDDFVAEEAGFLEGIFVVMLEEKVEVFESGVEFVGVFDGFIEELFGGGFVELFERGAGFGAGFGVEFGDIVVGVGGVGEFEHESATEEAFLLAVFGESLEGLL